MNYLKIVLFPTPFSPWSHSTVLKKSPLITGIVDWTKINSEQPFTFSESEVYYTFCQLQVYNLRLFRLFRGDSSSIDKSSSATYLLYSDDVKGEPMQVPCSLGNIRKRTKQRPWRKRQSRSWSFRFINILQLVSIYFFFQLFYFIICFLYVFYPRHLPTPIPTTHVLYPLPTTFSCTR